MPHQASHGRPAADRVHVSTRTAPTRPTQPHQRHGRVPAYHRTFTVNIKGTSDTSRVLHRNRHRPKPNDGQPTARRDSTRPNQNRSYAGTQPSSKSHQYPSTTRIRPGRRLTGPTNPGTSTSPPQPDLAKNQSGQQEQSLLTTDPPSRPTKHDHQPHNPSQGVRAPRPPGRGPVTPNPTPPHTPNSHTQPPRPTRNTKQVTPSPGVAHPITTQIGHAPTTEQTESQKHRTPECRQAKRPPPPRFTDTDDGPCAGRESVENRPPLAPSSRPSESSRSPKSRRVLAREFAHQRLRGRFTRRGSRKPLPAQPTGNTATERALENR